MFINFNTYEHIKTFRLLTDSARRRRFGHGVSTLAL